MSVKNIYRVILPTIILLGITVPSKNTYSLTLAQARAQEQCNKAINYENFLKYQHQELMSFHYALMQELNEINRSSNSTAYRVDRAYKIASALINKIPSIKKGLGNSLANRLVNEYIDLTNVLATFTPSNVADWVTQHSLRLGQTRNRIENQTGEASLKITKELKRTRDYMAQYCRQ